jgi:hypothetical protein
MHSFHGHKGVYPSAKRNVTVIGCNEIYIDIYIYIYSFLNCLRRFDKGCTFSYQMFVTVCVAKCLSITTFLCI